LEQTRWPNPLKAEQKKGYSSDLRGNEFATGGNNLLYSFQKMKMERTVH
jgi:hypothetical protein